MKRMRRAFVVGTILFAATAAAASAMQFSMWSTAQKIDEIGGNNADVNTAYLDGCPIQSPGGRRLYMASNRPGGKGGLDIWVLGVQASRVQIPPLRRRRAGSRPRARDPAQVASVGGDQVRYSAGSADRGGGKSAGGSAVSTWKRSTGSDSP